MRKINSLLDRSVLSRMIVSSTRVKISKKMTSLLLKGLGQKFRNFFIKIISKLGNRCQTVVFKNVNLYLIMQVKPTEFTILEHGQSKQEWPMKENGENYLNGKKNWTAEDN